jgi:putative SOS response-associated peptidase YedK
MMRSAFVQSLLFDKRAAGDPSTDGRHERSNGQLAPVARHIPDYRAPIVRNQPEGRELAMARWGMPSPVFALKGRNSDTGVTNIRNVKSPHWRRWLGIEHRCVVPFTSFSENETLADGSKPPSGSRLTRRGPSPASPESGRAGRPFGR